MAQGKHERKSSSKQPSLKSSREEKGGGGDVAAGAEDGQEVKVEASETAHLYGEVVMQFHVKADTHNHEGSPSSNIVVTRPLGPDGKPWRPVVCRWYVEKGPVEVRGVKQMWGGTVEWKPYNPK